MRSRAPANPTCATGASSPPMPPKRPPQAAARGVAALRPPGAGRAPTPISRGPAGPALAPVLGGDRRLRGPVANGVPNVQGATQPLSPAPPPFGRSLSTHSLRPARAPSAAPQARSGSKLPERGPSPERQRLPLPQAPASGAWGPSGLAAPSVPPAAAGRPPVSGQGSLRAPSPYAWGPGSTTSAGVSRGLQLGGQQTSTPRARWLRSPAAAPGLGRGDAQPRVPSRCRIQRAEHR